MAGLKNKKPKKAKKSRNPDALNAIVHRKGGPHSNKRDKIKITNEEENFSDFC